MGYKLTVTHKGWFGFCPVYYMADLHDPGCDPMPIPRYGLAWLFELSAFVMDALPIDGYFMTCAPMSKPKLIDMPHLAP